MANIRARQAGMSLVEIMVAVVLGLIGVLIITQAYISSDAFNRSTLGMTQIDLGNSLGTCEHLGGQLRCLRVLLGSGGQAKLCDPKVTDNTDPRFCG